MTTPFPFVSGAVLTAAQLNAITTLPVNAQTANYTLVVGDVGKRVQMTNAGSTTITVNTGIFAAGDTIWIQNMGAGTCTITAGTATVGTASSLALAQYGGGTLVFQSASAATFFSQQAATYGTATGGSSSSITVGGVNYTLLTFTSDGTLTVTKSGIFDILAVGGGAGATQYAAGAGGGGGAGGVAQGKIYLSANQSIVVGAGGAPAGVDDGNQTRFGRSSTVGTIPNCVFAAVGGFGLDNATGIGQGVIGGGQGSTFTASNSGISNVQGYKGGNGPGGATSAGGGGGAGAVGANGAGNTGGAGGAGYDVGSFISGSLFKAGGGGGGGNTTGGAGGSGVGGAGSGGGAGSTAAANTGGGGGGNGASGQAAGSGGSGIIYVRFKV